MGELDGREVLSRDFNLRHHVQARFRRNSRSWRLKRRAVPLLGHSLFRLELDFLGCCLSVSGGELRSSAVGKHSRAEPCAQEADSGSSRLQVEARHLTFTR